MLTNPKNLILSFDQNTDIAQGLNKKIEAIPDEALPLPHRNMLGSNYAIGMELPQESIAFIVKTMIETGDKTARQMANHIRRGHYFSAVAVESNYAAVFEMNMNPDYYWSVFYNAGPVGKLKDPVFFIIAHPDDRLPEGIAGSVFYSFGIGNLCYQRLITTETGGSPLYKVKKTS